MAFAWHKPCIVAKEESREGIAFATLATPDEIKEVTVPENGVIAVGYTANFKSFLAGNGRAAIFIGTSQLKADRGAASPSTPEASSKETSFHHLSSCGRGLEASTANVWGGDALTGQVLGASDTSPVGGLCWLWIEKAGTYDISVQYRATSGTVTAKERRLWIGVPE